MHLLDQDLDHIVENLTRELTSWKTMAIRVRNHDGRFKGKSAPTTIDAYRETATGHRWFQTTLQAPDGSRPLQSIIWDGSKSWNLNYTPDGRLVQAIIDKSIPREDTSGATIRPRPLGNLYVGLTPLHEAIQTAEKAGEETVMGRPCDGFRFSGVRLGQIKQDYVYFLDRETSIPLRIDIHRPTMPPGSPTLVGRWEAETLDTVGRYHVPFQSKIVGWGLGPSGDWEEMGHHTVTVVSIEYDQPIDEAIFRPEIGPGVVVHDTIAKKSYDSQPVAAPPKAETKTEATTTAPPPIEAIPPSHWTSSAPTIGIGLGLCVLAVGALLWLRGARR